MIYNVYYLRATQTKLAQFISLATRLGILSVDEGGVPFAIEGAYDYIGSIFVEGEEVKNAEGETLYHANLALPYSLEEVGALIAEEDTEMAQLFADIQEYFVVGPDSKPTVPVNPARTFLDADAYLASLPPPIEPFLEPPTEPSLELNGNGEGNEWTL